MYLFLQKHLETLATDDGDASNGEKEEACAAAVDKENRDMALLSQLNGDKDLYDRCAHLVLAEAAFLAVPLAH